MGINANPELGAAQEHRGGFALLPPGPCIAKTVEPWAGRAGGFPAGCGVWGCGEARKRRGEPGAGKPGGRARDSKRRDVEERGAGGFTRGVGTAAHGGSRRILPVLSPDSGGRGGKWGGGGKTRRLPHAGTAWR